MRMLIRHGRSLELVTEHTHGAISIRELQSRIWRALPKGCM